jgi:hypothetical protein
LEEYRYESVGKINESYGGGYLHWGV